MLQTVIQETAHEIALEVVLVTCMTCIIEQILKILHKNYTCILLKRF